MADTPNVELFYDTLMKILSNKLGVNIKHKLVKREPSDGNSLCRFE